MEHEVRIFITERREVVARAANGNEYRLEYDMPGNGEKLVPVFALLTKVADAPQVNSPT